MVLEALRYPIGRFDVSRQKESTEWHIWMLGVIPDLLRDAISGMTSEQLDTPYRSGGWTIRQIVHHFADSHMNGYAVSNRHLLRINLPFLHITKTVGWNCPVRSQWRHRWICWIPFTNVG